MGKPAEGRGAQLLGLRAAYDNELPKRAATLYTDARQAIAVARALRDAGDMPKALQAALQVPAKSPEYAAAARLVIAVAATRRAIHQEIEDFLAPYLESAPVALADQDAFFLLGQLYEVLDYSGLSQWLFQRLARLNPLHPVHAHLRSSKRGPEQDTIETAASGADLHAVRRQLMLGAAPRRSADGLEPGTAIAGRYLLGNLLGIGATAAVYEAVDAVSQRTLAIKISAFTTEDLLATRRFRREATLATKLVHANLVRVLDVGQDGGHSFLAMEYVEGIALDEAVKVGLPDPSLSGKLRLLLQGLAGLECAHAHGVVHRDIKPENILITREGVLKLMDFGLAKGRGEDRITASGVMGGTPSYISPEQITDIVRADERSDLYSFGVVAYELLTGRCPFEATALVELLVQHLNEEPASLRLIEPALPAALDAWVLKLLRKKPEERFQSCAEAAAELRSLA
jgi:serine/threonine-protein kinase